jgi:hypothetical protein
MSAKAEMDKSQALLKKLAWGIYKLQNMGKLFIGTSILFIPKVIVLYEPV